MSSLKNAILTRFDGGYRTDTNAGSISSNGRREAFLSLGSVRSSPNTDRVVSEYLGTLLRTRTVWCRSTWGRCWVV